MAEQYRDFAMRQYDCINRRDLDGFLEGISEDVEFRSLIAESEGETAAHQLTAAELSFLRRSQQRDMLPRLLSWRHPVTPFASVQCSQYRRPHPAAT